MAHSTCQFCSSLDAPNHPMPRSCAPDLPAPASRARRQPLSMGLATIGPLKLKYHFYALLKSMYSIPTTLDFLAVVTHVRTQIAVPIQKIGPGFASFDVAPEILIVLDRGVIPSHETRPVGGHDFSELHPAEPSPYTMDLVATSTPVLYAPAAPAAAPPTTPPAPAPAAPSTAPAATPAAPAAAPPTTATATAAPPTPPTTPPTAAPATTAPTPAPAPEALSPMLSLQPTSSLSNPSLVHPLPLIPFLISYV